jgi:hypothetical protein
MSTAPTPPARKRSPLQILKTDLKIWSYHWQTISGGTVMRCAWCVEDQPLSAAGRPFVHAPDCSAPEEGAAVYPWHALAALLGRLPAVKE